MGENCTNATNIPSNTDDCDGCFLNNKKTLQYIVTAAAAVLVIWLIAVLFRCIYRCGKKFKKSRQKARRQISTSSGPKAYEVINLSNPITANNQQASSTEGADGGYSQPVDSIANTSKLQQRKESIPPEVSAALAAVPEGEAAGRGETTAGSIDGAPYAEVKKIKPEATDKDVGGSSSEGNRQHQSTEETGSAPERSIQSPSKDCEQLSTAGTKAHSANIEQGKGAYIDVEFAPERERPTRQQTTVTSTNYTTVVPLKLNKSQEFETADFPLEPDNPQPRAPGYENVVLPASSQEGLTNGHTEQEESVCARHDSQEVAGASKEAEQANSSEADHECSSRHKRCPSTYVNVDPNSFSRSSSKDSAHAQAVGTDNIPSSTGVEDRNRSLPPADEQLQTGGGTEANVQPGKHPVEELDFLLNSLQSVGTTL